MVWVDSQICRINRAVINLIASIWLLMLIKFLILKGFRSLGVVLTHALLIQSQMALKIFAADCPFDSEFRKIRKIISPILFTITSTVKLSYNFLWARGTHSNVKKAPTNFRIGNQRYMDVMQNIV